MDAPVPAKAGRRVQILQRGGAASGSGRRLGAIVAAPGLDVFPLPFGPGKARQAIEVICAFALGARRTRRSNYALRVPKLRL